LEVVAHGYGIGSRFDFCQCLSVDASARGDGFTGEMTPQSSIFYALT
jgi:hypothetical protein